MVRTRFGARRRTSAGNVMETMRRARCRRRICHRFQCRGIREPGSRDGPEEALRAAVAPRLNRFGRRRLPQWANDRRIGRQGEIRDPTSEARRFRVAERDLLTAIIICGNTDQLGRTIRKRERAGPRTPENLLSLISPLAGNTSCSPTNASGPGCCTKMPGVSFRPGIDPTKADCSSDHAPERVPGHTSEPSGSTSGLKSTALRCAPLCNLRPARGRPSRSREFPQADSTANA